MSTKSRRNAPAATEPGDGPYSLLNPGTTSVTYDLAGHSLGGGERVQVEEVDRVGRGYVRASYLLCQDSSGTWIFWEKDGTVVERPLWSGAGEQPEGENAADAPAEPQTPGEPDQNSTDQVG